MKGKRVFVSGGAGVIGRELVPKLRAQGAEVLVGDLKPRPAQFSTDIIYRQGDLNYLAQGEFDFFKPDIFIHLAATFERSTESYEFWEQNFWHNVRLSHHLMSLGKECPSLKRVVFASSYLIYDPSLYQFESCPDSVVSLSERDPIAPRNLTGAAKLSHEVELRFLDGFAGQNRSAVSARIFRGYGRNSRDVISRWIRLLLEGRPIEVYRPEGQFDYIYSKDTAEGLLRLAETTDVAGVVNLGTGKARRVADVVDILAEHFPKLVRQDVPSDLPFEASQADMRRFVATVGWEPEYDLERAIPEMIEYERGRGERDADRKSQQLRILVSSASGKAPLVRAVQHAARSIVPHADIVAGDLNPKALTRYVADEFWETPPTDDTALQQIIDGCVERNITIVLPTRDGELPFWARQRSRLAAAGISILVSPLESLNLCRDKLAFSKFGLENALPFIPSARNVEDIEADRFVVKERFGAGSRSIGLNLDYHAALAHAARLVDPIFQPYVDGEEISIDGWLDRNHRVKGLVLRRRETVVNGESQVTTTFTDEALERQAVQILERLSLRGPIVMQAIIGRQGVLNVIECNPRFGGASTAAIAAGLDSLRWSLLEALGVDVGDYPFVRTEDIRQVRVPQDVYVNA